MSSPSSIAATGSGSVNTGNTRRGLSDEDTRTLAGTRMAMERLADTSTPGIHLEGGVRERSEIAYLQPSAAVNAEWNHFNETKTIKKYYSRLNSRYYGSKRDTGQSVLDVGV